MGSDKKKKARNSGSQRPAHAHAIGQFHAHEKRIAQAKTPIARFKLERDQDTLADYQSASLTGASSGGETSKWLVQQLPAVLVDEATGGEEAMPADTERPPLRLLDVGAISGTAYADCPDIVATSIDLHPQSETVTQADFFRLPTPLPAEAYDVVALSLVLNFVGSVEERGEMLRLTRAHLKPRGLLYLVLPLACVANSRFVDATRLRKILRIIGFEVLRQHDSAKLTYWLARWSGDERRDGRWAKQKIPDRQTGRRNNFAIVLK